MDCDAFRDGLLEVMERKRHWAWPQFRSGKVPVEKLHLHFEQEYGAYVRDFPVMVGWAYVHCPYPEVRRELAENLYEEETGGIAAKRPHPELFLEYPRGLGMDLSRFESIVLAPAAQRYRDCIDEHLRAGNWVVAACITTIFIEGTPYERGELEDSSPKRPVPPLEEHPLVLHYGLPVESLALTKAHRLVEGEHRQSAWRCVLDFAEAASYEPALAAMSEVLSGWLAYRDEVAAACGLEPS